MTSSKPNCLSKAQSPNTTLEIRSIAYEWSGTNIQSIAGGVTYVVCISPRSPILEWYTHLLCAVGVSS